MIQVKDKNKEKVPNTRLTKILNEVDSKEKHKHFQKIVQEKEAIMETFYSV